MHRDHLAEISNAPNCGKKRRKRDACRGIDWEDCIIELLLLHGANEAEIEQGQYKRLLDGCKLGDATSSVFEY
jgi:transcription factor IIIB subunit 2